MRASAEKTPEKEAPAASSGAGELATVAPQGGQALTVAEVTEMLDSHGGTDFGKDDLAIPFLRIVQALSPQVQPGDAKYVKEARQGMIIETVTPNFFDGDEGLIVIPVLYRREYAVFKPNRGGFVISYGSSPAILESVTKELTPAGKTVLKLPDGNEVEEAGWYYVLFARTDEGPYDQAVLPMSGTQWKTSREWNTNIGRVKITAPGSGTPIKNPAIFASSWRFKTIAQKKDNYNFFGWKVSQHKLTPELPNGPSLVKTASDFRRLIMEGKVRTVPDEQARDDDQPF